MSSAAFYLLILGIPAVVVVVGVVASSAARQRREDLLTATGRQAIGQILDLGRSDDGLGSVSYWIRVQYDYDGETVTASVVVSQREQQRYQRGQRVGLTYSASRPRVVRLDPPEWPVPRPGVSRPRPNADGTVAVRREPSAGGAVDRNRLNSRPP